MKDNERSMMRLMQLVCAAGVLCVVGGVNSACAQKPGSNRGTSVKSLDKKAADAQDSFLRTSAELARDYETAGELDKAKGVLRTMLKIAPELTKIRDKIKQIDEYQLSLNEAVLEVDPAAGWVPARIKVQKGKTVRFVSEGDCRLTLIQKVGPDGFPSGDVKTDLVTGVPLGGLMGIIVDQKGKFGEPFVVGAKAELQANLSGQLFLRVNVPPQSKTVGMYRVQITGEIDDGM